MNALFVWTMEEGQLEIDSFSCEKQTDNNKIESTPLVKAGISIQSSTCQFGFCTTALE